ncbi:MAG: BamA/TamA family outer membrane protein [Polyangiaceae bacterium]|nr:BamA/TamA family outer membrane protein [Polyangiaceae bacterium]
MHAQPRADVLRRPVKPAFGGRLAFAAIAAASLFSARDALAIDDPTLTWWTYESQHFRVTYPHTLEPVAERVATLAESIHTRLVPEMAYVPDEKTEILITDDTDAANGSATPIPYNSIRLFITAPDDISTLGDYDDWLLGLITHEYTHILHTGNISGLANVANSVIGKTLAPNSAQPRWIIEGLAVVFESDYTSGGRIRSSLFDAWIRADVLEDNIARLDQISSGAERWPYGNLFYLYGSRFLRWITDIYGPDTMPAVSADYGATTIPFAINRAIRRVTGRTYEDLYDAWVIHLKRHYAEQVAEVDKRGRREGARITFHGREALYPRFVPPAFRENKDAEEILFFRDDFNTTAGIYRLEVGDPDKSFDRDTDLVIRTAGDSLPTFSPEGDVVFSDVGIWRNLYSRHDLFTVPRGETNTTGTGPSRKRLTDGLRAMYPDMSPDGNHVVFCVNSKGTTTLSIADRDNTGTLTKIRPLVPSATFDQAYTPRYSPDGKKVAYSAWKRGGFRDIVIVDIATGKSTNVMHDRALDMQPVWSSDGKTLYFSSDRTGIFNVYSHDLATGEEKMITNVVGAAFAPTISADGKTLVYTGYTHEGYDLYAMKLDPTRFIAAPAAHEDRPEPYPEPPPVKLDKSRYNPLLTLRPHSYFIEIGPGNYSPNAVTFTASGSDFVGHHNIGAAIRFDPGAPTPRVDIDYGYGGLPVNLNAHFTHQVIPRTRGFRVSGVDVPYDETQTSFSTSASVPILDTFVSQSASITYAATLFHGNLSTPRKLDPFETVTVKPPEGLLSQFRLSYSLAATEGSVDVAGGTRSGFAMNAGVTYADPTIGSEESFYQFDAAATAYIPMPWPGNQTIAMRAAGGVSAGDRARGGTFFVGGYDLVNNSPLDTLVSGIYDGAFVLRGYPPGSFAGNEYFLSSIEYRAPIVKPNWGPSTLPIFLRRIDASAFADWGGAFDDFEFERVRPFFDEQLIWTPYLHTSVGLEVWLALTLAHRVDSSIRVGYAYGFSDEAYEDGQFYVLSTSAF